MGHETVDLFIITSHLLYIFPFDVIFMMMAVFDRVKKGGKKELAEITLLFNTTFPSIQSHRLHEEGHGKVIF